MRSARTARSAAASACLVAGLLLAGCGAADTQQAAGPTGTPDPTTAPATAAAPPTDPSPSPAATLDAAEGYVLSPTQDSLEVRSSPGDGEVVEVLDAVRDSGAPLTLLLADDPGDGWYQVLLPVRPNGSTGWVDVDDVSVAHVPYRLEMSVSTNELRLYEDGELLRTMPAASGTGDTPTPRGTFYLTELIEPTNAGYGPYAYGTSGFSDVLTSFGGGPGQIGLHGTDDPSSVGRAVSHGCIRLSDEDITFLAETLPLGTPIDVVETSTRT